MATGSSQTPTVARAVVAASSQMRGCHRIDRFLEPCRSAKAPAASHKNANASSGTFIKPVAPTATPVATAAPLLRVFNVLPMSTPAAASKASPSSLGIAGGNNSYTEFGEATTRSAPKAARLGESEKFGPPAEIHPNPPTSETEAAAAHPARRSISLARHAADSGMAATMRTCMASCALATLLPGTRRIMVASRAWNPHGYALRPNWGAGPLGTGSPDRS